MKQGTVRIIGGQWRGRKLKFPALPGVRPTPDRVRETLFNWLTPAILDANCLDLFAGSGALGFEALSRGARSITFVDQAPEIIAYVRQQATLLQAHNVFFYCAQIPPSNPFMKEAYAQFNIVFLDPPFKQNLIPPCCEWLEKQNCLADNAYIYLEAETSLDPLPIPPHWELIRSKTTQQVGYHLARRFIP